ncbi:hypothetical protein N7478_002142 [Penicillium angulare]|uniref:uncharacterized protein n=1 Tax=Penicillium angulare TaxID=116970 RepID=UPI00253FF5A8|nr:uncharacterized protein N7478_002142 [Penicillium angulare]KAJ5289112.1 hypothetical protein N7478_002142 [Penicillium angulare]
MNLTLLLILGLVPFVLADDWEDFTNNLATDLAPLITLFGERLTKQFLSESISILDNVIFALSPLGVLTAVVSVIRICGSSSLRAFVGRAQEGPAEAEGELLPCVSESTAELFNDGGISRVFGRPRIVEVVAWEEGSTTKIGTLRDAIREGAWSVKGSESRSEKTDEVVSMLELDIPNLSLNKGIKQVDQLWFYAAAILGALLQIGVLIYAALTVFVFPDSFKVDDGAVDSYAFPLYVIGTTFLFMGMFYCAVIIERSSKEYYIKPNKPSKLYWLQPGEQTVGDQVFNSFLAVKEEGQSSMTYIKSKRVQKYDGRFVEVYSTIFLTLMGFIFQFIGERGLHASVILAQLGSTFIMSVLRTCLRTERMKPEENKLREERDLVSYKQQELDAFAFYLEGIDSFSLVTSPILSNVNSNGYVSQSNDSMVQRVLRTRARLAELTSKSDDTSWDDIPIRKMAQSLARTIETTMDIMSSWGMEFKDHFEFPLAFEATPSSTKTSPADLGSWSIELTRGNDVLRWRVDTNKLEAIIGLWAWSLYRSKNEWREPLYRMVGINQAQAGQAENYLDFQKWIFRQTEAKLVPAKLVDEPKRLFGFNPNIFPSDSEVLAVKTENNLEKMIAQDIYIRFLKSVFSTMNSLGGDVDVIPGLQNPWVAQSTRINDLVQCFENCHMGSREDALVCIIPSLKQSNILPDLAADCPHIRKRIENHRRSGDWASAFSILNWMCCRSEGSEFERSVYVLGYLCRRAMLSNNKAVREEGFNQVCVLLGPDVRYSFFQTQNQSNFLNWVISPSRDLWWQVFGWQLGWISWQISVENGGMHWIQAKLGSFGISECLKTLEASPLDLEDTVKGITAMKDWLATKQVESKRQIMDNDEEIGFEWAVKTKQFALVHWFLLYYIELGDDSPSLIAVVWFWAAKYQVDWAIQMLHRHGADINSTNPDGHTALSICIDFAGFEAIELLLINGANPDGNDKAPDGRPILIAAYSGNIRLLDTLIRHGADIEITDRMGLTALRYACDNNQPIAARFLLSNGAEIDTTDARTHTTPLGFAITNERFELIKVLLEFGPNLNIQDSHGHTPLMRAVAGQSARIMGLLLEKGTDITAMDHRGQDALAMARENQFVEGVQILELWMNHS